MQSIIELFKRSGFYLLLIVLLFSLPALLSGYHLYVLNKIMIYSIVCFGLVLLIGYSGLISIGHAAFFVIGAYTSALLYILDFHKNMDNLWKNVNRPDNIAI